jgi:hypothetical protein
MLNKMPQPAPDATGRQYLGKLDDGEVALAERLLEVVETDKGRRRCHIFLRFFSRKIQKHTGTNGNFAGQTRGA